MFLSFCPCNRDGRDTHEQRLQAICIVRRSKSLPDSDATDHAADLNDFLSSRSGEDEEKETAGGNKDSADNELLELRPRARRKESADEPVPRQKPLIKLTPFAEEQRRALTYEAPPTGEKIVVEVQLEPAALAVLEQGPSGTAEPPISAMEVRRRRESVERVTRYLEQQEASDVAEEEQQHPTQLLIPEDVSPKRRSSLKRRRDESFDDAQDAGAVVPTETTKKTVRICSVEEEIRIESFDSCEMDELVAFPELQLVTTKITTAEELADSMAIRRDESLRSPCKDEAVALLKLGESSGTQQPSLKPSASENALGRGRPEEERISEKNIAREILMDLSKADDGEEDRLSQLAPQARPKRRLSRVSSDSAAASRPHVQFHMGDDELSHSQIDLANLVDDETFPEPPPPLAQPSQPPQTQQQQPEQDSRVAERKWNSAEEVGRPFEVELRRWGSASGEFGPGRRHRSRSVERRTRTRVSLGAFLPKEKPPPPPPDDASQLPLLGHEHSLIYQRQTLESPASLEDLLATDVSSSCGVAELEAVSLGEYSSCGSLASASVGSPRRSAHTQTQGDHKASQYDVEDLAGLFPESAGSRERLELWLEARFGSPRREACCQTEQESKGVQCESEELDATSRPFGPSRQPSFGSPRKDVHVQTGQDARGTQCDFHEFDADPLWRPPLQDSRKRDVICPGSSSADSQEADEVVVRPPLIVLVKGGAKVDMTVTHRDKDGNVVWAKHWGPERLVEIYREHQTSLGLSIVGGKVDLQDSSSSQSQNVSGIFIKNVLPNSPAGRAGGLQVGDRIIEVDGVDLRNSTHERAVKAIQASGNPVRLLVQSLVHLSPDNEGGGVGGGGGGGGGGGREEGSRAPRRQSQRRGGGSPSGSIRRRPGSPSERIQDGQSGMKRQDSGDGAGPSGRRSSMKKSIRKKAPSPPGGGGGGGGGGGATQEAGEETKSAPKPKPANKYSSGESSEEEEDTRMLEGNVYTKSGVEIARKSAGNVKRSKAEIAADPEEEDEFGYTTNKVKKKYHNVKDPVIFVTLEKDRSGLGISLAGHKDRNKMAVFICGINPGGVAYKSGQLKPGDEIVEVNGNVLQGRCHLNASSVIKSLPFTTYKIIAFRRPNGTDICAVKPITQFPTQLAGDDYSNFIGVHEVPIKKGTYGLGIMIIEGKHSEVGQGIFVSDIQVGSAAEQAGLNVGDMILAVNADSVMGATYDDATALLKKAEGVVKLTVCNPNQKQAAEDEEKKARGEKVEPRAKEPDKPKEPEKPQDPKDAAIRANKDTVIEFPKDKDKPIGFVTIGGYDTSHNAVFILDVFTDGAAGKDGRLQPGDRIVEFNKEAFKTIDQEKAYQTVMRVVQGPIHMTVHRDEKAYEEYEVELSKKAGKGSGLCLVGYKSGKGAYVSEVVAGGSAAESGKILKGDRVVSVGGTDLREAPVEDIALHVKVSNPVPLKLARYRMK